jgi:hypothetical protein
MKLLTKLWIVSVLVAVLSLVGRGSGYSEVITCGIGTIPCADVPVQGGALFNTQTTGAVTTAVTVTLTASPGQRVLVHAVEARCNTAAATSGLTITDGGTTIWSTVATEVLAANNFFRNWTPALSGTTNSQVVVTLAACTAGTGTLIVQASKQ